jgi:hypothetical protein
MAIARRWLIFFMTLAWAAPALAQDSTAPSDQDLEYEDRIAELERTVRVLADELERARTDTAVPESRELVSRYGLGPGASRVYDISQGLSIGGYGEAFYRNYVSDKQPGDSDMADYLRTIIYVGYKFTDSILFNSEIEIEHADEIFLEFANLDFLLTDYANIRAGLVLMPMGFINEIHEPTFFYGVNRPDVERFLIPSTWRENGVGLFGNLGELFEYRMYAVNGLNATGFDASGIRGGRQKGSKALAEDIAFVGRLDFRPMENLLVGGSVYAGNSGQNQDGVPDAFTTLYDIHAQYQWQNLWLRALWTQVFVSQADSLTEALRASGDIGGSEAIASVMMGGYGEIAYDIWPLLADSPRSLEPYYRFSWYDTQYDMPDGFDRDRNFRRTVHTVGMQFKPIPNVVIKADYRNRDAQEGQLSDEFNLGIGYVF